MKSTSEIIAEQKARVAQLKAQEKRERETVKLLRAEKLYDRPDLIGRAINWLREQAAAAPSVSVTGQGDAQ